MKPVDKKKNPGLAKLPKTVRNKMGYMKNGGKAMKPKGMKNGGKMMKPKGMKMGGKMMKPKGMKKGGKVIKGPYS